MPLRKRSAAFSLEQRLKALGLDLEQRARLMVYIEDEVRERCAIAVENAMAGAKKRISALEESVMNLMDALEKKHLPAYDRRTGLLRGDYFEELLPKLVSGLCSERPNERRSGCPTLVIGDVRNLKVYNDLHGHEVGDALLEAVGFTTRTSLRLSHDWAARANDKGDEIEILMTGTRGPIDAGIAASRVKDALTQRKDWSQFHTLLNSVPPDVDFGAAGLKGRSLRGILKDLSPEQRQEKIGDLIKKWRREADQCMYVSKETRSDHVTFRWFDYVDGELVDITNQMDQEKRLHDLRR